MSKKLKSFLLIFLALFVFVNPLFAQTDSTTQKGKIVIVILDVSGSIEKQFPNITKIIDKSIVKDRLNVGDYFVLIPFGDAALPMYSGQLLREEDKTSISNTLNAMRADNNYTDIGQAIKVALNYIVDLKQNDYNLYEPLVLFITDGDITTSSASPFYNQKVDDIFNDSLIGNKSLYDGWYYVGIGKNLHDLPDIAKKSGREDYLLTIEDLSQLEFMLDDWISKIPEPQPLDLGEIVFDNFSLKSYSIGKADYSTVIENAEEISFDIISTYERTLADLKFLSGTATFQSDDKKNIIKINMVPETGLIQIPAGGQVKTTSSFEPESKIKGKGILKVQLLAQVNGEKKEFNNVFAIEGKSNLQMFLDKFLLPMIITFVLILLLIAILIIRKFLPVKVTMEIVGKPSLKFKSVSMKMKKKVDFGSKPGLHFKLDGEQFNSIVGQIQRIGADKWLIIPRDYSAFDDATKSFPYKLNTIIKLKTREDDETVSIKFKLKKK